VKESVACEFFTTTVSSRARQGHKGQFATMPTRGLGRAVPKAARAEDWDRSTSKQCRQPTLETFNHRLQLLECHQTTLQRFQIRLEAA
jgi:hypothetical protein